MPITEMDERLTSETSNRAAIDGMLTRASVSQLREPAPEGRDLEQILSAAMRAPDHGRLRPWRFRLIRGDARLAFANMMEQAARAREPDIAEAALEKQRNRWLGTPLIIAIGCQIKPAHKIPEFEQILSVGAATMNILNALHALGFGGVWLSGANCYDPSVASRLGFEAPDRLAGFLRVGTPDGAIPHVVRPDWQDFASDWNA